MSPSTPTDSVSTNSLIVCLKALLREMKRCEQTLATTDLPEEAAGEWGEYAMDLQRALGEIAESYRARQRQDSTLTDVEALIRSLETGS
jgi:hypothetical protein